MTDRQQLIDAGVQAGDDWLSNASARIYRVVRVYLSRDGERRMVAYRPIRGGVPAGSKQICAVSYFLETHHPLNRRSAGDDRG